MFDIIFYYFFNILFYFILGHEDNIESEDPQTSCIVDDRLTDLNDDQVLLLNIIKDN